MNASTAPASDIVTAFWATCVIPGARITRRELYAAYSLWWRQAHPAGRLVSLAAFNREIALTVATMGYPAPPKGSGYWYGVTVLPTWQPYRAGA